MSWVDEGRRPTEWELFTPDYDYVKEPYWVRVAETDTPVICYPNAGLLHEMSGKGRYFYPCQCEVKFAGWEEDPHHPRYKGKQSAT